MATALKQPDTPFSVGVSCPGCGGEVDLQQDFFVTTCTHCGSVLRVLAPDVPPAFYAVPKINASQARPAVDRYLKEHGMPLTNSHPVIKSILYPYWKIDGLAIKIRHVTEEPPVSDETGASEDARPERQFRRSVSMSPYTHTVAAGVADDLIPVSIGLRAGYLKLRPYDTDLLPLGYEAMTLARDWSDALARAKTSTQAITSATGDRLQGNRTDLSCMRASVVYVPYLIIEWYGRTIMRAAVDAVSGRVAGYAERPTDEMAVVSAEPNAHFNFGLLGIEFHRCAICGRDLPTEPSYVYTCANCGRLTLLGPLRHHAIECAPSRPDDLLVPFWRVKPTDSAIPVMIPAFRIANAEAGYRLARRMTGAASRLKTTVTPPTSNHCAPVNIEPAEARALADTIAFRHALEYNDKACFVASSPDTPASLVFVPFHPDDYFWTDSVLGVVTFERALTRPAQCGSIR